MKTTINIPEEELSQLVRQYLFRVRGIDKVTKIEFKVVNISHDETEFGGCEVQVDLRVDNPD